MKTIYKRIIGLSMAMPGLGLLYLLYSNRNLDITNLTMTQIVIFIIGILISIAIMNIFVWGMWLFIVGPKD